LELLELTPEQVSQAFLCLVNQQEPPLELQELSEQQWQEIAQLLFLLEEELRLSQVH
jgi:hypothetical protein